MSPYEGDAALLAGATARTQGIRDSLSVLRKEERARGVLDVCAERGASITAHDAGYIDEKNELIVGLQTGARLKRAIMPNGGLRMVENGLEALGFKIDPMVKEIGEKYRKSHHQSVLDAYTPAILAARKSGVITGLPDADGRIIGDYRRVALYGVGVLIVERKKNWMAITPMTQRQDQAPALLLGEMSWFKQADQRAAGEPDTPGTTELGVAESRPIDHALKPLCTAKTLLRKRQVGRDAQHAHAGTAGGLLIELAHRQRASRHVDAGKNFRILLPAKSASVTSARSPLFRLKTGARLPTAGKTPDASIRLPRRVMVGMESLWLTPHPAHMPSRFNHARSGGLKAFHLRDRPYRFFFHDCDYHSVHGCQVARAVGSRCRVLNNSKETPCT
ncbi:hypothetical protein M3P88_13290 [Craterilacuibacter sp. RT1T]|nr:pyruvate formate lyase family protein [Craterilacuibacter sp. RT1T]MCL6264344.1 hypothetical protein [Craterilacuibacter sp. RT1T]